MKFQTRTHVRRLPLRFRLTAAAPRLPSPPACDSDPTIRVFGAELLQEHLANPTIPTVRIEYQEVTKTMRMSRIQILLANTQERFVAKCKAARKLHVMFRATDGDGWQYQNG